MLRAAAAAAAPASLAPSGFFVLRSAVLPYDDLLRWGEAGAGADVGPLRARLRHSLERACVREALLLASPSLCEALPAWREDPEGVKGRRIEAALVRYLARMAGRATPFGLFAAITVGRVAEQTDLRLAPASRIRRRTRLDMEWLLALAARLERDPELRDTLLYHPNSSLHRVGSEWRYVESRFDGRRRSHHLVAVTASEALDAVLERARPGASLEALAGAVVASQPAGALRPEEARGFVQEVVDGQIVVSDLSPGVTGPEPLEALIGRLAQRPRTEAAVAALQRIQRGLAALDARGIGRPAGAYAPLARELRDALDTPGGSDNLFQVDLARPALAATLGRGVVREVLNAVAALHRISAPPAASPLQRFREAFVERYGEREVPLLEALDEESGIGFAHPAPPAGPEAPLLDGLVFPEGDPAPTASWSARDRGLLARVVEAARRGEREIALAADDLAGLQVESEPPPLPDAVEATCLLAQPHAAADAPFVFVKDVHGPSGARTLGRFCHLDEELLGRVRDHLRAEEALRPEAIFAEIAHLPEGRAGNILCRPVLRAHEIPFLGRSGAAPSAQIPVADLRVSAAESRVRLRSARLGREVVPRLTNAHAFQHSRLGVYRFLCALQQQGVRVIPPWQWGPLDGLAFLPRVRLGRALLVRACWRLGEPELRALAAASRPARWEAVQALRRRLELPRLLLLQDERSPDNELPLDLDNALSVEAALALLRGRRQARLVEVFPAPGCSAVRGPDGSHAHEIVVPLVRVGAAAPAAPPPEVHASPSTVHARSFVPGSEWLYAKFYCGPAAADALLLGLQASLAAWQAGGAVDRWFFVRYADPHGHLRLRLHGAPERLHAEVLAGLRAAATHASLAGQVWRVQLDTYEQEVERYGGADGVRLAERIFHADSEAALELVRIAVDHGADARWRLTLLGLEALLVDLGLDLAQRGRAADALRHSYRREFRADRALLEGLEAGFRRERSGLEAASALLAGAAPAPDGWLGRGLQALRRRSGRLAAVIQELRQALEAGRLSCGAEALASSVLHMHANRMLASEVRRQELVLYDYLGRLLRSRLRRR